MRIQQLLEHHHVIRNPFAEEDAQSDPVFKDYCIESTYHPAWDKVYGDPREPATAVVFGEKGSGKTAMRLQIARRLAQHNRRSADGRVFVLEYDDFNPFLDRFRDRFLRHRGIDRVLAHWKLWDHMDAILSLGVTGLVDAILEVKQPTAAVAVKVDPLRVDALDRHQARDLLVLAACYDQSTAETFKGRWHRLRRRLHFGTIRAHWDLAVGIGGTVVVAAIVVALLTSAQWGWLAHFWMYLVLLAIAWGPRMWRIVRRGILAVGIARHLRVGNRQSNPLRQVLMHFTGAEIDGQPLPNKDRSDDRYELLCKFQGILHALGYSGIAVLVDRVDEPYLINGSPELMKALLWPMLDNKFLKHPGLGLKLMLPIELLRFVEREDREFYQRARLDKQNMITSFAWSGESLYDVANARMQACAEDGASPRLRDLLADSVSDQRLIEAMRTLRVPRHLFKFLYRLLVAHANAHREGEPAWQVAPETFEATLALYQRDQDAADRGLSAG